MSISLSIEEFQNLHLRIEQIELNYKNIVIPMNQRFDQLEQKLEKNFQHKKTGSISYQLAKRVTAIVGLKEAITSKNEKLRYLWSFLLIVGIGATCFYTYQTTKEYLEYPTATNVWLNSSESYIFPPISLCPLTWFNLEKASKLNLSLDALKYSLGYIDHYYRLKIDNATSAKREFLNYYSKNYNLLSDYYSAISTDLAMVGESEFVSTREPAHHCSNCKEDRPPKKVFTGDFMCYGYTFHNFQDGISSPRVIIMAKTIDMSGSVYSKTFNSWALFVSQSEFFETSRFSFFILEPNYYYFIKILPKQLITLEKGVTRLFCKREKDLEKDYSQHVCRINCENEIYMKRLNCNLCFHPRTAKLNDFCNYHDYYGNSTFNDFFETKEYAELTKSVTKECFEKCPFKCNKTSYEVSMVSQFAFEKFDYMNVADISKQPNTSAIVVSILHGGATDGGVMVYEEVTTYSFISLISCVGGVLGLFVGGTVMTFVQIALFFVSYLIEKGVRKGP